MLSIETKALALALAKFIKPSQLAVMVEYADKSEESAFFVGKIKEMADRIEGMPVTYEQDGKGDDAIIYLHYFHARGADVWITEKDMCDEQLQAFGLVDLGFGPELGYVHIGDLLDAGFELDLHFEPKPLKDIRKS